MTDREQQLMDELAELKAENEALKTARTKGTLTLRVSKKGAVSVYGLGRFPVTLYAEQWERVFNLQDSILAFIEDNKESLSVKTLRIAE